MLCNKLDKKKKKERKIGRSLAPWTQVLLNSIVGKANEQKDKKKTMVAYIDEEL